MTAAFALAGALLGLIFMEKGLVWTFALTFVPARVCFGSTGMTLWGSLVATWVTYRVFRWRGRRRRLV